MYTVDDRDAVIFLEQVVQPDPGAPLPVVLAAEHDVLVSYIVRDDDPNWDDRSIASVPNDQSDERLAIVRFTAPYAHTFGPPNDEAFSGHPLHSRGLGPWRIQEVRSSSWIRRLERMNSVHPYHRQERFNRFRHFVLAFHDSTFECISEGIHVTLMRGSMHDAAQRMSQMMRGDTP